MDWYLITLAARFPQIFRDRISKMPKAFSMQDESSPGSIPMRPLGRHDPAF